LQGETGTGKEVLANFLHERSGRRGRVVRVNCGAIPASLLESTLFGHEQGAFTGALKQRGMFEAADKGTLFLDEIGELTLAAQVALLRVLETKSVCRVGSTHELPVDVRVIAATHRDLEAMVKEGSFREDLYYRLSVIVLEIPPLRERRDEIERLCVRFLEQVNQANGRGVRGISEEAMTLLKAYGWPGNVRELRNAVERAVVLARGDWIQADDLPARVREAQIGGKEDPAEGKTGEGERAGPPSELKAQVQQFEAQRLKAALRAVDWNVSEAARRLGISPTTLRRKMKELGLKRPKR
jgi:DNA-binding NtrC family response regulator